MPSPDFSRYVDLTIYDKDPGQIYLDAVSYAQRVALPEFNPRVGSLEDALLQATSYATAELVGAVNRVPDGLMEGILNLYGFERRQSISARVTLSIDVIDSAGTTIPTGTLFSTSIEGINGLETYFFATVADLVINAGSDNGTVEAESLTVGIIPVVDPATEMIPVSGTSRILAAETVGTMTQGQDDETDLSYFTRGAAFLASRSTALATSLQMQNFLSTYLAEIGRAYVSDLTAFKYMRVSSITRTNKTVTAVVSGLGSSWTTTNSTISFLDSDVIDNTTRVIVRFVDDSATTSKINGAAFSGSDWRVKTSVYNSVAGTYTLTFDTNSSADVDVEYFPTTSAPHNVHNAGEETPDDHYIEILIAPSDYNEHPGSVGLVFGNANGLPIQNTSQTNIESAVAEKAVAGLSFTSIAPIIVPIDVDIEVEHLPTFSAVDVRDAVQLAVETLFSPAQWAFNTNVYKNTIIGTAASVAGVKRVGVVALSVTAGNFQDLGTYSTDEGGYIAFEYPFCLPSANVSVSGVA